MRVYVFTHVCDLAGAQDGKSVKLSPATRDNIVYMLQIYYLVGVTIPLSKWQKGIVQHVLGFCGAWNELDLMFMKEREVSVSHPVCLCVCVCACLRRCVHVFIN